MKKLLSVLLITAIVFSISACTEDGDIEPVIKGEIELTDFEKVSLLKDSITINNTDSIESNIQIPLVDTENDVSISWSSSNESIISNLGIVQRPSFEEGDVTVTFTVSLSLGDSTDSKIFLVTVKALPKVDVIDSIDPIDPVDEDCDGMMTLNGEAIVTITQGTYYKDPEVESEYLSTNTSCPTSGDIWYEVTYSFEGGEAAEGINTTLVGQYIATYNQRKSEYGIDNTIARVINIIEDTSLDVISPENVTVDDVRILNKIYVNNASELDDALDDLAPGDAVILRNGTYNNISESIYGNGTKANPIFIMAEHPGEAIISGESQFTIKGSRIILAGLSFLNGSPKYDGGIIRVEGNYNRVTNNTIIDFETPNEKQSWVNFSGVYNELDHNYFEGKTTKGVMVVITRSIGKEDHHHIHHNYFKDFTNPENFDNELEVIRIGTSNESRSMSYTIVEYNVFDGMDAETENISVKAGGCEIRGNLIINSASLITLRHGIDSIVEDNIIIGNDKLGTGGIRIYDTGHIIRNNYIIGINTGNTDFRGAIVVHSGGMEPGGSTAVNGQCTPYNIVIENNTIINCSQGIVFEDSKSNTNYGPKNISFKDNFIWTDDITDAIYKYSTTGVSNLYESTITSTGDVYYGGRMNSGDGTLSNTGIEMTSFLTTTPSTTTVDGIIYFVGDKGAKNLELLETK